MIGILLCIAIIAVAAFAGYRFTRSTAPTDPNATVGATDKAPEAK